MLRNVLLQQLCSKKTLLAYWAMMLDASRRHSSERMLGSMDAHMRLQISFGRKSALTDLTFEWSFA